MGRDKRNEGRTEHYTKLIRPMMETPAWRSLSSTAQALYPWVKLEWRGPQANNNGNIRLPLRTAANAMGLGSLTTIGRAFHDLQRHGFLVVTEAAHLGTSGSAKGPAYEITELPLPGQTGAGRRLYLEWRPGHDFPVLTGGANNPLGVGGNSKPRLRIVEGQR